MKPGYKQTEVGVIPEEWDAVPISSLTPQNRKNGIVDGPFGSNLKTIHYRTSGIPIITSGYVTDGRFHAGKYLYVDRSKFMEEKRSAVQPGDIVMAKIGERCGASAILPHTHETGILSGNALKITVDELRHSTSFVWQVLWSLHLSGKLEALRTVGAQPALSMAGLKRFKIPVPPTKAEQRAIATALSDVDGLLGGLDRLIAKKRDLKQAAMQQLLTSQTRLPGFHGEWEVKRLGELAKIQRGASPRPIDSPVWFDDSSSIGWVRISDVTRAGMFLLETTQRLSPLGVQHSRPVPTGSLIMSICATVGRPIITQIDVCIHDGFVVFDNLQTDQRFLYYVLKWIEPDWLKHGQTGSQMNLNTGLINGTRISLPPLPEQTAIAEVLTEMDAELAGLMQRHDKTRALKQAMMQELLTGRTRLL